MIDAQSARRASNSVKFSKREAFQEDYKTQLDAIESKIKESILQEHRSVSLSEGIDYHNDMLNQLVDLLEHLGYHVSTHASHIYIEWR